MRGKFPLHAMDDIQSGCVSVSFSPQKQTERSDQAALGEKGKESRVARKDALQHPLAGAQPTKFLGKNPVRRGLFHLESLGPSALPPRKQQEDRAADDGQTHRGRLRNNCDDELRTHGAAHGLGTEA